MEQYNVTGMSCAACSARVEKAVKKVPGVTSCSVSLLTNSMGVEGTASSAAIIQAVQEAGYGASPKAAGAAAASSPSADLDALADHETPKLKRRLIASLGFLLVLMYFSMGHMMWGWPLPHWFDGNHVAMGLVQLLLAGIVMVINQKFFINGFKGLIHGSPNMDTLVAMGSMASFVWSTYALFAMTRAQVDGNDELVMHYMMEFYFESAAMILTLITVGKMLEARSKGKTTDALKSLMKLAPKTASVERDGKEIDFDITRKTIVTKSVSSEVKEDNIGYLRITSFDENTYKEFKENLSNLKEKGIKGLVIDLRDNPGGLLDVCVDIADDLIGEGTIVYTKDNKGETQYYKSDKNKVDLPIVVLINENSASASEILTAAIVDNKAGIAVGTTSYGKGLVQSVREFNDGTGYKLTTAQYYTPNGNYINKQGIKPNIVEKNKEKQLDRAIEYIKKNK